MEKKVDRNIFFNTFREESQDHIKIITEGLLELERSKENEEVLANVFRSAHSLKGAAALMGFLEIRDIAHKMEDVFSEVRDEKIIFTPEIITSLLTSVDQIKKNIQDEEYNVKNKLDSNEKYIDQVNKENIPAMVNRRGQGRRVNERRQEQRRDLDVQAGVSEKMRSIRIAVEKLDELMNLVGELVVNKISFDNPLQKILHLIEDEDEITNVSNYIKKVFESNLVLFPREEIEDIERNLNILENYFISKHEFIVTTLAELHECMRKFELISNNLQESIMESRMLPLSTIFDEFHRSVRDMSVECHKEVNLIIKGGETELDKKILEEIKDPMIHLLRNSVDHGIEAPEERLNKGKIREGLIAINAYHQGNYIFIEVEDDGAGLDIDLIKEKAIEKGITTKRELNYISDKDVSNYIFTTGFSTKKIITDISGRGIGMSVVKKNISDLKGTIQIDSVKDQGLKFIIKLPLTLAILQVLMIKSGNQTFAVPLSNIEESRRILKKDIRTIENNFVMNYFDEIIPLIYLQEVLKIKTDVSRDREFLPVIILASGEEKMGFVVDELMGRKEVVSKTLGSFLNKIKNISGATIMGTGEVVLILDIASLLFNARWSHESTLSHKVLSKVAEKNKLKTILVVDDSLTTRELEKAILENSDFLVETACDGKEGYDKAIKNKYDLIVTDIDMPRIDGFAFTEMLKKNKDTAGIPVVIVSAKKNEEFKKRGIEVGAEAYILKSGFDQNNLINTIRSLLR